MNEFKKAEEHMNIRISCPECGNTIITSHVCLATLINCVFCKKTFVVKGETTGGCFLQEK